MTDYTEKVEALRNCANVNYEEGAESASCSKCPYRKENFCNRIMLNDAADAIEKLIKMIIKWQEYCYDSDERIIELEKAIAKLKAQIHPSEKTLDILEMIEEVK